MGIFNNTGSGSSSGGVTGLAANQAVFTFKGVAETIDKGDFVTLDTLTGTVQRANAINATLFGQNAAGADSPVSLNTWTTQCNAKVYDNTDGTLLYVESFQHTSLANGTPQLIKVAADGTEILKATTLPNNSGASPVLVPLASGRIAHLSYGGPATLNVNVYDTNTLALLDTKAIAFTGGTTNPFSQVGDAIETGGGQIVLHWGYSSIRYYAVLNADFTVKTQPTSAGGMQSSFNVIERLKLSSGRVLFVTSWYDGSSSNTNIVHFDTAGNFSATKDLGSGASLFGANHVEQLKARERRVVAEVAASKVAYITYTTSSSNLTFYTLDLTNNTTAFASNVGDANHEITWCAKGDYVYVLAQYNSGAPMVLKQAVFNITTGTVKQALATLINVTSSYSLKFDVAFLRGTDELWTLGTDGGVSYRGNIFWWCFTLADGVITVKYSRTSITSNGAIQDVLVTNDEAIVVYGGTSDGSNWTTVFALRIHLLTGALAGNTQLRTHTTGQANLYGLSQSPEAKILFRPSMETAFLFGYGAGAAPSVLTRMYFKVNASILLGVAANAAAAGSVQTILSGWANVSSRYGKFQKTIDHTASNGNKAKTYGAAAYLTGSF